MIKRLSKLREYRAGMNEKQYLSTEHRQNLQAIQKQFDSVSQSNHAQSQLISFTATSSPSVDTITGLKASIKTAGNPVFISIIEPTDQSGITSATDCVIKITRSDKSGESDVCFKRILGSASMQSCGLVFIDIVDGGEYSYQAKIVATNAAVTNLKLSLHEI